jgi:hypothetical protein
MKGHERFASNNNLKVIDNLPIKGDNNKVDKTQFLIEKIKSHPSAQKLNKAIETEKRIRLHTVGTQDDSTSFYDWITSVQEILPSSKFEVFKTLVGEPVPTLTLSEQIFDELAKIFEASNPSQKMTFEGDSERKANEFNNYFNIAKFFKSEVYDRLKVAPNSFLVVDTKLEELDGKPQPITYFVNLEAIVDVSVNRDGSTNYILFKTSEDRIIGIDDTAYYVFKKEGNDYITLDGYPSPHNLKDRLGRPYTPAFLIYPNFLNATDNIAVNSPLTKSLGSLEWLLFWAVSKRHLDLYAPFPIYVSFEENCTYSDGAIACQDGWLYDSSSEAEQSTSRTPCPKCSKQKTFGAGTSVEVPAPQSKEDPNLLNAINVIGAEKDSIEYVTNEKIRLEQEIYYSILGKTSQPLETFSQSVSQLDLSTESRKAVLLAMKEIFETVQSKVLYTMAKIMYGEDFIDCYVNYGDNYFLTTPEQETKNYKSLKDAGAPEGILHSNLERIIWTTYKTSPSTALLNQVYLEAEPFQTMSIENVAKLVAVNMIPKKKALGKIHFTDFVEQFEAEHQALVNMIELGQASKDQVVKVIKEQLSKYVEEVYKELQEDVEVANKQLEATNKINETSTDLAKPSSTTKRKYREEDKD